MNISVFGKSVVGYKNEIKNSESQDYLSYKINNDSIICSIADGHSGEYFKFSDKGAQFACDSLTEVMYKYIMKEKNIEYVKNLLDKKVIQYEIYSKWLKKVSCHYEQNMPKVFKKSYFRYGTTLLGLIIYKDYIIYLKLGDGDFLVKENNYYKKVFPRVDQPKVDTLPDVNSYKKFKYSIDKIKENSKNYFVIMYSDGYENSFYNVSEMIKDVNYVIKQRTKNVFSRFEMELKYEKYLRKLSKENSKDDISIIFVNIL